MVHPVHSNRDDDDDDDDADADADGDDDDDDDSDSDSDSDSDPDSDDDDDDADDVVIQFQLSNNLQDWEHRSNRADGPLTSEITNVSWIWSLLTDGICPWHVSRLFLDISGSNGLCMFMFLKFNWTQWTQWIHWSHKNCMISHVYDIQYYDIYCIRIYSH